MRYYNCIENLKTVKYAIFILFFVRFKQSFHWVELNSPLHSIVFYFSAMGDRSPFRMGEDHIHINSYCHWRSYQLNYFVYYLTLFYNHMNGRPVVVSIGFYSIDSVIIRFVSVLCP